MWEVQLISTDTITPSSPTPEHLRLFKLSMLDQLTPRIYVRLLLFYSCSTKDNERSQAIHKLKTSLSETLNLFYPLAGRLKGDDGVDCNDDGVDFLETQVKGHLHDFLEDPDPEVLDEFLPCDIVRARSGRKVLLAVQVNAFDCGGIVIGVGISHAVADGASLAIFANRWATTARGACNSAGPTFDSPVIFPAIKVPKLAQPPDSVLAIKENLSTKRFVFRGANMALLYGWAGSGPSTARPTRVEAVSTLIWRCMMKARKQSATAQVALHAVCMRKRMDPPLPEYSFGNLVAGAITSWEPGEEEAQSRLERQLREAIRAIDGEYIREMQGPYGLDKVCGPLSATMERYSTCGVDLCFFSSWCRFPLYEVDYGWGRPIWASVGRNGAKDSVILMDDRTGDGIEAWICLEEEVMAKFERDKELLSFVSLPNVVDFQ